MCKGLGGDTGEGLGHTGARIGSRRMAPMTGSVRANRRATGKKSLGGRIPGQEGRKIYWEFGKDRGSFCFRTNALGNHFLQFQSIILCELAKKKGDEMGFVSLFFLSLLFLF